MKVTSHTRTSRARSPFSMKASDKKEIVLVAAAAENDALGRDNKLLWHLPDDFKRFKELTSGHCIIMGRKTFESLPGILPNRTHIVISRNPDYNPPDCIVVGNLTEAIAKVPDGHPAFVIGGGQIYSQAIDIADRVELTRVHHRFDADTFFPQIDTLAFEITFEEHHPADQRHQYPFSFVTYRRRVANQ